VACHSTFVSRLVKLTIGSSGLEKTNLMSSSFWRMGSSCSWTMSCKIGTFLNIVNQNSGIPWTFSIQKTQNTTFIHLIFSSFGVVQSFCMHHRRCTHGNPNSIGTWTSCYILLINNAKIKRYKTRCAFRWTHPLVVNTHWQGKNIIFSLFGLLEKRIWASMHFSTQFPPTDLLHEVHRQHTVKNLQTRTWT